MKYKLSVIPAVSHVFKEYLIYWLVFFIPVNKMISSYIIIAIFLFWLMEGKFKERFKLVVDDKKRVFLFSLSALYFLYLIGSLACSHVLQSNQSKCDCCLAGAHTRAKTSNCLFRPAKLATCHCSYTC